MTTPVRRASMGFIFLTIILDVLGTGIIIPILPKLIQSFEGGDLAKASSDYGLLIALYSLMSFLFASFMGSLSDRYGRRPVLLLSLLGLALDYVIVALAPNLIWLVAGRLIAGVFGASVVTATAYVADITAPQDRAKNFGMLGAAFGLGFIIGPLLGGFLGSLDLRLPFWVAAGLSALNMLYGVFVLPESLPREHRLPFSWARANPIGTVAVLRQIPNVLSLTTAYGLTRLSLNGLIAVWVLYTAHRFGWGAAEVGISLAVTGIVQAIAQGALVAPILARFGERRAIVWSIALSAFSYVLFGLASTAWMLYAAILLSASGGILAPAMQAVLSGRTPPNQQGLLQGALASLNNLANVIAPPIVAATFAYVISSNAGLPVGVPLFLCAAVELTALLIAASALRGWTAAPLAQPTPSEYHSNEA
jgi:MFS transporter, DHA1 family, tetracycline resistance protein